MKREQKTTVDAEIKSYLATGEADIYASAWSGCNIIEKGIAQKCDLLNALISEVKRRAHSLTSSALPAGFELLSFAASRLKPMVAGFFSENEREIVLALLAESIVFLTSSDIEDILRKQQCKGTAWRLANMYLASLGVRGLDGEMFPAVGMSEGNKCYVSTLYFEEKDRFADFVVHEAAHIFHNWKRSYAGLPEKRRQEWLLAIGYNRRETFAYACEAYSRILTLGKKARERVALVEEFAARGVVPDDRVDFDELIGILREAAAARNGWKRILKCCAPSKRRALEAD